MLTGFAIWTLLLSLVTAGLYVWDKQQARRNGRRISENTLLAWSALGGWPGGLITGQLIRHKTQKVSYRVWFVLAAIVNVAVLSATWYFTR
ncbi:MAG: DUF1294 domain-containing protein [Pirellulaceae bacterium]